MSILNDKLKNFNYYKSKVPMYLQQSDGFLEHFRIWFDLLVGETSNSNIVGVADTLFQMLDIFAENYDSASSTDVLNKLAALFGIQRHLVINGKTVDLSNDELLTYLSTKIIKNYSDGTTKQAIDLYDKIGLPIAIKTDASKSATVTLYLLHSESVTINNNIQLLFTNGLLNFDRIGITYTNIVFEIANILYWSPSTEHSDIYWAPSINGSKAGVWA